MPKEDPSGLYSHPNLPPARKEMRGYMKVGRYTEGCDIRCTSA